jgi:hypothetical protein
MRPASDRSGCGFRFAISIALSRALSATAISMGLTIMKEESESGDLEIDGDPSLARSMQQCLGRSAFARQPRRVQ